MAYDSPKLGEYQFKNPPKPMEVAWEAVQQVNELADGGTKMRVLGYRARASLNWGEGWLRDNKDLTGLINIVQGNETGLDSNITLLLHGDGDSGDTTFTDVSDNQFSVTSCGTIVSRQQNKFGNGSMYFDGIDDKLRISSGVNVNDGSWDMSGAEWSIETQIYRTEDGGGFQSVFSQSTDANNRFLVGLGVSGTATILVRSGGVKVASAVATDVIIPLRSWTWVKWAQSGNDHMIWIAGTKVASAVQANTIATHSGDIVIGDRLQGVATPFIGYMDELTVRTKSAGNTDDTLSAPTFPYTTGKQPTDIIHFKPRPDTKPWLTYEMLWTNQEEFVFHDGHFGVYGGTVDLISPTITATIGDKP